MIGNSLQFGQLNFTTPKSSGDICDAQLEQLDIFNSILLTPNLNLYEIIEKINSKINIFYDLS